ncbi:glycerol kinase GlpK [bacterium]|nr:glycerol kinase GlpK [bacterium]
MNVYVAALDQGTTSSRCFLFDENGKEVSRAQKEHQQIFLRPGYVEHDALEIWKNCLEVIESAVKQIDLNSASIAAMGITNQRETIVIWDSETGQPLHPAIVWQDMRAQSLVQQIGDFESTLRFRTGLPASTYFSSTKIQWLLQNVPAVQDAVRKGKALAGTIDSWLVWNFTGGPKRGTHITDVSNASRTQLFDLNAQQWDPELASFFEIPLKLLPRIAPSIDSKAYGVVSCGSVLDGVPIGAVLGDQQAALFGQLCLLPGEAKNTYGTGNFLLVNTGNHIIHSSSGLLSTVAYQFANALPVFALEGSAAVTGSAVQWLRDQLRIIGKASDIEELANQVQDNGGVYFVPAFSGLYAPYWRPDVRGLITGLSRFNTAAHLARATLEAICYQTKEVLDAMESDSQQQISILKVDGGPTANSTLMQLQADILGIPVIKPVVSETTALGAAYGAGLSAGVWSDSNELSAHAQMDRQWDPQWSPDQREQGYRGWKNAIRQVLQSSS